MTERLVKPILVLLRLYDLSHLASCREGRWIDADVRAEGVLVEENRTARKTHVSSPKDWVGSLHRLAHAAGHGHFCGVFTSRRTVPLGFGIARAGHFDCFRDVHAVRIHRFS